MVLAIAKDPYIYHRFKTLNLGWALTKDPIENVLKRNYFCKLSLPLADPLQPHSRCTSSIRVFPILILTLNLTLTLTLDIFWASAKDPQP